MGLEVLLIDDHTLFREGLKGLLGHRGIAIAGEAGNGPEGLDLAASLKPDVVLLDMRMPKMDGNTVLRKLRQSGFDQPIVMLTTSSDERDLIESLRNGANGYLLKDMDPDDLVLALRDIVSGKTVVAPGLAPVLARFVQGKDIIEDTPNPFADLTPRESEILVLLADGQSNKVIARNLGISDGTVKLHVKSILRKLGVHSRVEAAVIAVENGLRSERDYNQETLDH